MKIPQISTLLFQLLEAFGMEKQEGEKSGNFEARLISEINKILNLDLT